MQVHALAERVGIVVGEPCFTLLERSYTLPPSLKRPTLVEDLADWLIAVTDVLAVEPDTKLFPLVSRLAYLSIRYTYDTKLDRSATARLTSDLHDAFELLRHGDPHEARAAFVLALLCVTRPLG